MLVYFPFIFFLILTFYFWKRKGYIDVGVFLFAEYALTSFFAILCVHLNLLGDGGIHFTQTTLQLNLIPTLLYCIFVSLVIFPFTKLNIKEVDFIFVPNERVFNLLNYFLFAVAILNVYVVIDNVISVLQEGDFLSVRNAHYAGETDLEKMESLPKILGYFYYFNRSTLLALPCFFYSICFLKKHWIYNCLLLMTALSLPLAGIQMADRTEFIFFAQTFILSFLLFRPFIKDKQKKFLKKLITPLCVFFVLYLSAVTIARFGEREANASGGAIQYAGQGYLNFCYFYEFTKEESVFPHRMFPLITYIIKDESYLSDIKDIQNDQQDFYVSVFPTFIGDFFLDTGFWGLLLWIIGFLLITKFTFQFTNKNAISLGSVIWYYVLAIIPMFGIFYYPYFEFMHGIFLALSVCVSIFLHYRFKI